jgi:hypothetical protein
MPVLPATPVRATAVAGEAAIAEEAATGAAAIDPFASAKQHGAFDQVPQRFLDSF